MVVGHPTPLCRHCRTVSAENLAVMRHIVFDMIRRDKVTSGGIKGKKKEVTWSQDKMLEVLLAA